MVGLRLRACILALILLVLMAFNSHNHYTLLVDLMSIFQRSSLSALYIDSMAHLLNFIGLSFALQQNFVCLSNFCWVGANLMAILTLDKPGSPNSCLVILTMR